MQELITIEEGTAIIAQETADKIAELQKAYKNIEESLKEIKAQLYQEMKDRNILKIETPTLVVSYIPETTTETLDLKELKRDLPEIFNDYSVEKKKAGCVKLTTREKDVNMGD